MSILANYKVSYAQNREDLILEAFFPDVEKGTYIDVGANHPIRHSVTKRFYDKGWRGINIEPNPDLFKLIEKMRPEDINLNIGVGSNEAELNFRVYHSRDGLAGLSTFSDSMKKVYEKHETVDTTDYTDVKVKVLPLKAILNQYKFNKINFLKVDVEGFEYEVLKGNNWKKFRPEMICIEANHLVHNWHELLTEVGYETVFNDGLNEYMLAQEAADRAQKFNYANTMLLSKPVINSDLAETLDYLQAQVKTLNIKTSTLESDLAQAVSQRNSLFAQLEQYAGIRSQARMLMLGIYHRLLLEIEKLNKPGKPKHVIKLSESTGHATKKQMAAIALRYDKKALRESRILHDNARHLMYVGLRFSLFAFAKAMKKLVRLLKAIKRKLR